jgi:hypothetical protein
MRAYFSSSQPLDSKGTYFSLGFKGLPPTSRGGIADKNRNELGAQNMYRNEIPTYFPGDIIRLRFRFHHVVDVDDVWANFEKREEVTTLKSFRFTVKLQNPADLKQLDRSDTQLVSETTLRVSVTKSSPVPGIYDLSEIHALPAGEGRAVDNVLDLEIPKNVCFRIADTSHEPQPEITYWELGWERQDRNDEAER